MRIMKFSGQSAWGLLAVLIANFLLAADLSAQSVDLVVNITSDQPAYMAQDLQTFSVTISNNGPDPASSVVLVVEHPVADLPFEFSATCQALPGPNPNGPAVCPPGSGSAPSTAFVRTGQTFRVTLPAIPAQSQARVEFETRAHCPPFDGVGEPSCFGVPTGNFTITADVTAAESDSNSVTNSSTTNVFLFPPDVQYAVRITSAPATATPGSVVEYEFEVASFGLNLSDLLDLKVRIRGEAGSMTPLSASNHPFGANGSTLPNTELLAIDCLSASLGSFPPGSVFPAAPAAWQTCPSTGSIPIPTPISPSNLAPVSGFPVGDFLENLPGTVDGPPAGGVMRFRAQVRVGDPVCVNAPDIGDRNLVFEFSVQGLQGTDLVAPGPADNVASVITTVPGNCEVADIEFTTTPVPTNLTLDANGEASWVHELTVTNLSFGPSAGTATNVPFNFEHHSLAFAMTHGTLTCASSPSTPNLCPTNLTAGIVSSTASNFQFASVIPVLPPGASVTLSVPVSISRTTCWAINTAYINLSGQASPSPALYDPIFGTTPPMPPPFTPGSNPFFGNNGLQTALPVNGLVPCSGGAPSAFIEVDKSGPFASAADAVAGTPLIGQTPGSFITDGTQVFYKIVVSNPNTVNAVPVGQLTDNNFNLPGLAGSPPTGFVHTGNTLADWGITCTASPATESCHELASAFFAAGYTNAFRLNYDPALHGGDSEVALAPGGSLTYIVPFTLPIHINRCHGPDRTSNQASATFASPTGTLLTTPMSIVDQFIGMPPCVPGALAIDKQILPPATANSIPPSGEISWSVTLTNASPTETLDIPHFIDQTFAFGVDADIVNISCSVLSGGAQCPATAVIPGVQTPASGPTSPLANPLAIDHEWGFVGNNTFPPGSSIGFVITAQLANPDSTFGCISNNASFDGQSDLNGWIQAQDSAVSCPPPGPDLSLQKRVFPQIAGPGDSVTYTVTVLNIDTASANGAVLIDPFPAALLSSNPNGYVNVSCTDISNSSFIPNPQGTAVCPPITSNASGLQATIASFGPNSALQFSYQAVMPQSVVSVDNLATVLPAGMSFGAGTSQSQQNVQVIDQPTGAPEDGIAIPTLSPWALILLILALLTLTFGFLTGRKWPGQQTARTP